MFATIAPSALSLDVRTAPVTSPKTVHRPDPERVERMFGEIAPRYDLLNALLSLGRHHRWRRVAADLATPPPGGVALDICTGTGDLARELAKRVGSSGFVAGLDFCEEMLLLAEAKPRRRTDGLICYMAADAMALPLSDSSVDCATVAFGIRNVQDPARAFAEMVRVVRTGGRVVCLEFGLPEDRLRRRLVRAYEKTVVPALGGTLSRRSAYRYLSGSIAGFASPAEVRQMMSRAGLAAVQSVAMNLGSVYAHWGVKA